MVASAFDDLGPGQAEVGEVVDQGSHDVVGDGVVARALAEVVGMGSRAATCIAILESCTFRCSSFGWMR